MLEPLVLANLAITLVTAVAVAFVLRDTRAIVAFLREIRRGRESHR